jgi:hypothetical protein
MKNLKYLTKILRKKQITKFLKIQDGAHIQYGVFFASFYISSGIRQKLQNAKVFAYS